MTSDLHHELAEDHPTLLGAIAPARQILLIAALAGLLLGWLTTHTDIFFADGLRYISQARAIDRGSAVEGLKNAVDHPVYPLAIAAVHRVTGGNDPHAWQVAAQLASSLAGVILVLPLYLVNRELFGERAAVAGCLLFYAVPLTGHVFADTLSESTFLLFWLTGLWAALRFIKSGRVAWIPLVLVGSALAYLTRPEGLLLPAAVVTTLVLSPRWVLGGLGKRGVIIVGLLVIGAAVLVGPYVLMKGGLGTKPSVARLLGTAPRSAAHAVERQKPLAFNQSLSKTYVLAVKAVEKAVNDAVGLPLLIFAVPGIVLTRPREGAIRQWKLLAVIAVASLLALIRLHATGGYCSPRHAILLSTILIPAAASGVYRLTSIAAGHLGKGWTRAAVALRVVILIALLLPQMGETLSPLNDGLRGYRDAGVWLTERGEHHGKVVDVTGWSQFYSGRTGYTFADLISATDDPDSRWVVVREAHLVGPWDYCRRLRTLVDGLTPVVVFPGETGPRRTRVLVFDRSTIKSVRRRGDAGTVRR